MNIVYVGNFGVDFSTESHIDATLRDMGHSVIRVQEDKWTPAELTKLLMAVDFDLFLFTRTWGQTVTAEHLDILKARKTPSASYHLDLYVGLKRDGGIDTDPFWRTDFVFTPDGDARSAKVFQRKGINHHYIRPGVFRAECYIPKVPVQREIIFVGSYQGYHPEWPYREKLIDWLKSTYKKRFQLWGPQGKGHVRGDMLNRLYAQTRIVIGDSLVTNFDHEYYWSDRVYETLGRGGFMIHPRIKGMEEELVDREHLVYYDFNNFGQLAELINYYLKNDSEREAIRRAGHEFVKLNCTYHERLAQMFDILKTEGAIK